ncbi:TPA: hypothetical protein DCZ15_00455 [Candidatus Falkowbacteria bacterium]|nr:hypothetical protein [Candidatus Falkowbacteria bacterium]
MSKTIEVFGVSNSDIKSYIERESVDLLFLRAIETRKHIIVFGSSKQGKSALTNRHLAETEFVRINCAPETTPIDIYRSILRQLNIKFEIEKSLREETKGGISGEVRAKVLIPFFSGDAKVGSELAGTSSEEIKYSTVEYNLELPQDICEILIKIGFKKRIILENFHYLPEEVQKQLAHHLRVFEDNNILFIILGIWREKNRLAQFNGDLQDRLIEIPVEPWSKEDFRKIIESGSPLLNVRFDEIFEELVNLSFDSVGVFQELCKEVCLAAGVENTGADKVILGFDNLRKAKEKKWQDYSGRHLRSVETFIEQRGGGSADTQLFLPYYFIKFLFVQDFDAMVAGFKRVEIQTGIKSFHHRPNDVRPSDMSNFLHNIVASQIKRGIVPPLFDYDKSIRTLKIIDSTFYFFIRNADLQEIFESFDVPEGIELAH